MNGPVPIPCVLGLSVWYMLFGTIAE